MKTLEEQRTEVRNDNRLVLNIAWGVMAGLWLFLLSAGAVATVVYLVYSAIP